MKIVIDIYIKGYVRFFQLIEKWWGQAPGNHLLAGTAYIVAHYISALAVCMYLSDFFDLKFLKLPGLPRSWIAAFLIAMIVSQHLFIVRKGRHIPFLKKFEKETDKQRRYALMKTGVYLYWAPVSMLIYFIIVSWMEMP